MDLPEAKNRSGEVKAGGGSGSYVSNLRKKNIKDLFAKIGKGKMSSKESTFAVNRSTNLNSSRQNNLNRYRQS